MANQLSSIQSATADILIKLAQMNEQIRTDLRKQSVRDLHREIKSCVADYARELRTIDEYVDHAAWLNAKRQDDLTDILRRLSKSRSNLQVGDYPTDSDAAIAVTIASVTEAALLNHLDYDGPTARSRLKEYVKWIDRIVNPHEPSSAAHEVVDRNNQRTAQLDELRSGPFGQQMERALGTSLAPIERCVAVNYAMTHANGRRYPPPEQGPVTRQWATSYLRKVPAYENPEFQTEWDRLIAVVEGGHAISRPNFTLFNLWPTPPFKANATAPFQAHVPSKCQEFRASALRGTNPGLPAQLRTIEEAPEWHTAVQQYATFSAQIQRFNEITLELEYARSTVEAALQTKKALLEIIDTYSI
ncbi:hypothetical protein [Microvirga tunisiensis]|uniref:Uncharacterized protein n=1 Tax=Microvirga tunisiensis TaxID=2108360 RepID=A0A5N7MNV2_9HYPH|nr:hypothetical protein [Microvirga tunisiensis]MPR11134.1 hypothetical protein [Microvirga tunisiensis]MPR28528.1 hypothetical protein [Microvirga tunisiensis]